MLSLSRPARTLWSLLAIGAVTACSKASTHQVPRHYLVFLDCSESVFEETPLATRKLRERVLRALVPGDTVAVYVVNGNTVGTDPVFSAGSQPLTPDAGYETLARQRALFRKLREGLEATLAHARELPRSDHTDLLGAIDRTSAVLKVAQGNVHVVIVSDFLNSSRELEMSRAIPSPGQAAELVPKIALAHGWSPTTLRGATITGVLPSRPKATASPEQRRRLKDFWQSVFESLGGRLESFDI